MKKRPNGAKPGPVAPGRIEAPKEKAAGVLPTTATKEQSAASVPPVEKLSKLRADLRGDCRVPLGYRLYPAEFMSKGGTARWIDLIRKATRAGVSIDLVYGQFRHRPNYLIQRNREALACLDNPEAASRWLDDIQSTGGCK
jgi:hypothetical protein